MIEWKDTSSYSQKDKERIPNSWSTTVRRVDFAIHRHIYYPKDTWLMSSKFFNMSQKELKNTDTELAKREASIIIKHQIVSQISQLNEALEIIMMGIK